MSLLSLHPPLDVSPEHCGPGGVQQPLVRSFQRSGLWVVVRGGRLRDGIILDSAPS